MNLRKYGILVFLLGMLAMGVGLPAVGQEAGLRVATFDIDATPPIGSDLAYDPVINQWPLGLRGRGIVLEGAGAPIVLCAIDWIGVANEANDIFRQAIADAAETTPDRVAIHTVHQHDAPACDFTAEKVLEEFGITAERDNGDFPRAFLTRLADAVRAARPKAQPVTHVGLGVAKVSEVASNRRVLGPDGKVSGVRYTACKDPELRAAPEGTIDPEVSLISLWNGDAPVAVLSYYACHPQSYYRTGVANPDFPGIARFMRELAVPAALHIHFNGAGGNIGAGKYNDGAMENRGILAKRLEDGMRRAWEATRKQPITAADVAWETDPVALPPGTYLDEEALKIALEQKNEDAFSIHNAAAKLGWLRRCHAGLKINIACLTLGNARILHMPGELFVEYQLAAKAMRPDLFVAMAAYGNYGTGYIGTAVAYEQGGYETSDRVSNVSPAVEEVLTDSMKRLLHVAAQN